MDKVEKKIQEEEEKRQEYTHTHTIKVIAICPLCKERTEGEEELTFKKRKGWDIVDVFLGGL